MQLFFSRKKILVHGRVKEAEIRVVAMHNLNNIKKISYLVGNKEIYNKSIVPYDIYGL